MTNAERSSPTRGKQIRTWMRKRRKRLKEWYASLNLFGGRASKHHLYEAKERYNTLKSIIESKARELNIPVPDEEQYELEELDFNDISKQCHEAPGVNGSKVNECIALLSCFKTLLDTKRYLSRRPEHLNILWRALTHIRIRLLECGLLSNMLIRHLNFCKEEAFRLGLRNDPEVKEKIERLEEEIDPKNPTGENPKFTSIYIALLEHFNTIRTGRIHQQYINVKIYTRALVMLLLLSLPLLLFGGNFLEGVSGTVAEYQATGSVIGDVISNMLRNNRLAFVFFSGLLGGLFSVAMRERPRERIPGEDAYHTRYMITKPFIGAVGAMFLYILVLGGFFRTELIQDMSRLKDTGALTFGFAFVSGFTERLVFPSFR